jgi:predicted Zn-dependent protease
MLSEHQLQALAQRVLGLSQADETEVLLLGQISRLTRFANNTIHQNVAESNVQVRVRATVGQQVGVATTDDVTDAGLAGVAERAVALARLQTADPFFTGLPGPDGAISGALIDLGYAEATARCAPEVRARAAGVICDAAERAGLIGSGAFSTVEEAVAVGNSLGLWRYHVGTTAKLNTVVMAATGSGWASATSSDVADIHPAELAHEAVDIATRAQNPTDLPPGEYPVVLGPDAVADMLGFFGYVSFNGLAVHEGRSFVASRMGQQVMAPAVSIWDDGRDPAGLPLPFDFEGVAKQRVSLVENGVVKAAVWDRRSAAKAGGGRVSTGHALPAPSNYGALPAHLFMKPGTASREDLLAGIERGVWVTRFWYTRVVHPLEVVMTGMTRDGTFLIENGKVTRPVRNLRFTHSYLAAMADVEAISAETRLIESGMFGAVRAPTIRVRRFTFTGATQE